MTEGLRLVSRSKNVVAQLQQLNLGDNPQAKEFQAYLCRLLFRQLESIGLCPQKDTPVAGLKAHVKGFYDRWLAQSFSFLAGDGYLAYDGESCSAVDPAPHDLTRVWEEWDRKKGVWQEDPNLKAQVVLVEATLRALPEIVTGKRAATDVMFPNSSMELVEGIYRNNIVADCFNEILADALVDHVGKLVEDHPSERVRIIEIGAGTGGTSAMLFKKLKPYRHHIEEYCYTDISKAFLLHAESTFGPENPYLAYRIFNVEKPLSGQGIPPGRYDLAVATNVLHATRNIRHTLRNVKALLKKQGQVLINELSGNPLFSHLTFGLLEGWWLYEDAALRIPGCPGLYPEGWQGVLESEGFHAVSFPGAEIHFLGQQVIVAESDGVVRQAKVSALPQPEGRQREASPAPAQALTTSQPGAEPQRFRKRKETRKSSEVTERALEDRVKSAVRESVAASLKMNEGQVQDDRSFSEYGVDSIIAVSLVNLINKELNLSMQTTVLFDYSSVDQLCRHIVSEYQAEVAALLQAEFPAPASTAEDEEDEPELHPVSALFHQGWQQRQAEPQNRTAHAEPAAAATPESYHRVVIERPGDIESLRVLESALPPLEAHQIRVAVRAFSLNFGDLLCLRGLYPTMPPYPFTPGFEASGVVVETGIGVTSVRRGDAVVVGTGEALGGQATLITCAAEQVFPKPQNLSFEDAAALPTVAMTMIDAFRKARVQKGEKILIQTAAGGTGLIAVQLAQHHGAEIYATAGSKRKLDYLERLGVHHGINYLETDFEKEVKRLTNGQGVDVVINTLAGDAIQKGLNCLAPGGRYIEIAMTALKSARSIDLSVLNRNQSFYAVDLRKLGFDHPDVIADYTDEMLALIEKGTIKATISRLFRFDQIKEAFRCLDDRESIGKVVVTIPEAFRYREPGVAVVTPSFERSHRPHGDDAIAVIGMSGRFAKSKNLDELWAHLADGRNLIEEVSRWDLSAYPREETYCKWGGFLEDIDCFDPLFFKISGMEAKFMDPQQRMFLEESWKALEDAGYVGATADGSSCGVYVGSGGGDYQHMFGDAPPPQAFWGNAGSVIPARIAYYLNLKGPAITVDTACSSSLVAIHLACQGLWSGEIGLALAGGVFLQCTPGFYRSSNRAGMLSPRGQCHAFDDRADGFVPGEGVGAVVLKRLKEAVADRDHIYGVIRGSALNQDGTTNGITAPSARSQEQLECQVYDAFRIDPAEIQMVEAHGTGTKLGDPIEYQALTRSFRKYTDKKEFCAIGSVKTNIGHAANAAGVAGVLKVLLSLQHRQIPPSLHFQSGNPDIQFKESPFFVNTELREWPAEGNTKRRAAVSSFGFSGTNAHLVIEEAPEVRQKAMERAGYLLVLSARTAEQLRRQVEQFVGYGECNPQLHLGDMSFTLLLGRRHFDHRLACVARTLPEFLGLLKKWLEKGSALQVYVSDLKEGRHQEQTLLKRYGNQCINDCRKTNDAGACLEYLCAIADLYVQGYVLQFEELFSSEPYYRMSLPTYPFARNRYWVETAGVKPGGTFAQAPRREAPAPNQIEPPTAKAPVPTAVGGEGPAPARCILRPLPEVRLDFPQTTRRSDGISLLPL